MKSNEFTAGFCTLYNYCLLRDINATNSFIIFMKKYKAVYYPSLENMPVLGYTSLYL